ncbi:DUF6308 family protein, partial [Streptomyces anthocyanicus]|uniref:DUF6308 family protein n=1 Tax=Streptomyces anthocyanicus TaxID=68174 RepID=UPI0033E1A540
MAEANADDLAPGSPADAAWHLLQDQPGIGWVTAGKLLARKRPRLLPVYDQVVRCILRRPPSFWLDLQAALQADNCRTARPHPAGRRGSGRTDRSRLRTPA